MCQQYIPGNTIEPVTVPFILRTLQSDLIHQYPAAHLGPEKTTATVHHVGYWIICYMTSTNIVMIMNALCVRHSRLSHH